MFQSFSQVRVEWHHALPPDGSRVARGDDGIVYCRRAEPLVCQPNHGAASGPTLIAQLDRYSAYRHCAWSRCQMITPYISSIESLYIDNMVDIEDYKSPVN